MINFGVIIKGRASNEPYESNFFCEHGAAGAAWASGCSALEGTCSIGLPLKHNLSTTDECTRVQHIYTDRVTKPHIQYVNDLSDVKGCVH